MTVRVLALASGTTSLESHRLGLAPLGTPTTVLNNRSGLYPPLTSADLSTVSAMVAAISPFSAWIDGTSTATQGGYSFTSDAAVNITFDAGNASTTRTDRVIARIKDDPYDGSGSQVGSVEYLKGNTTTGAATTLPASSLLLWEVAVPAGASAGGGGINFSSAKTDKRVWTATNGGTIPVKDQTDRDTLTGYAGLSVYRIDLNCVETHDGTAWRTGPIRVANEAALSGVSNAIEGNVAYVADQDILYLYEGATNGWRPLNRIIGRHQRTTGAGATTSEIGVIRLPVSVKAGRAYEIRSSPIPLFSSTTGDWAFARIRYTTDGSTPTTSSTSLGTISGLSSGGWTHANISEPYYAATDHTLYVLLTLGRFTGSGNVSAGIDATNCPHITLQVIDNGKDPGNGGTTI